MYYQPSSNHVFKCHPCEARRCRSCAVSQEFGGNAEPHRSQADGDVVRAVQGDCGVHAPGVAAFARQCGPH